MIRARIGPGAVLLALLLAAPVIATSPVMAQQAGESANSAEIAFWNSIKDAKTAAEYEAYLQAFPNGLFAPLARLRVQQLASGNGAPPAPAPPGPVQKDPPRQQQSQPAPAAPAQPQNPAQDVPVDTTNRQIVGEVQSKLFNLNYQIDRFDGVLDTTTRNSIREWQEKISVQATGVLTEAQYQRLRASRTPAVWGAIAYTANGTTGVTWNRASRQEAQEVAINECRRRAGRRASCDILSAGDSACLALATYRARSGNTIYYGARPVLQPDLGRAVAMALQRCQESERSRGTCVSKVAICGDGSHDKRR